MIALLVIAYLLVGAVALRIWHRVLPLDPRDEIDFVMPVILCVAGWPVVLSVGAVVGVFYAAWRFASMPTRRERLEGRRKRLSEEIARLENELGVR